MFFGQEKIFKGNFFFANLRKQICANNLQQGPERALPKGTRISPGPTDQGAPLGRPGRTRSSKEFEARPFLAPNPLDLGPNA